MKQGRGKAVSVGQVAFILGVLVLQVAFAALKKDGSLVTWGGHYLDLDLSSGNSGRSLGLAEPVHDCD